MHIKYSKIINSLTPNFCAKTSNMSKIIRLTSFVQAASKQVALSTSSLLSIDALLGGSIQDNS